MTPDQWSALADLLRTLKEETERQGRLIEALRVALAETIAFAPVNTEALRMRIPGLFAGAMPGASPGARQLAAETLPLIEALLEAAEASRARNAPA